MSDLSVRLRRATKREEDDDTPLHPHEQTALEKLQAEAEKRGVTLQNDGKGGLPPSLVLGVFRRDKFRCKRCGTKKMLTLHHKGGIVESDWLSRKGHTNDPNNIVVLCAECHDEMHNEARDEGIDSSQMKPEGDKKEEEAHG